MTFPNISPALARIRAAGVLRVGTTGDYPPFCRRRADGGYEGADIEMAHDLAERLGVRVAFVPSVWVELLDDFIADKFDIAMGGVTVTAARAEMAFFSVPTFVDGKRHHDNATVFDELVAGRADVMVTDGLEADHQAQLHPELVAVPVAPWTRLEKAYMFARDPAMKDYVDTWLAAAFASGQWQRALDRAMSAHSGDPG